MENYFESIETEKTLNLVPNAHGVRFDAQIKGKPVYSFLYYDPNLDLSLRDESYIIILDTKCDPKLVPEQLKPLYAYVNDPGRIEDEFIQQLDERVQQYNSKEWRLVQVTLEHMLKDKEQKDIEKGRAEGRAEVRAETQITTAKRMLQEGLDVKLIMKITDLTEEAVLQLKEEA